MSKTVVTVGDMVIYWPGQYDIDELRQLINEGKAINLPLIDQPMPAVVVAVWGEYCINLKVMVDGGIPDIWRTSVQHISQVGTPIDGPKNVYCWEMVHQARYGGRL